MHAHTFETPSGLKLAASVGGPESGLPVLLLHGGGQTRHAWRHAAADLVACGRRVISLDLRGHGDSQWAADGDYSFDALVADLRAVLATLEQPPALVGASLGGLTSLLVAGEDPPVPLRALVLVDVVPRLEREGVMQIVGFMLAHADGFESLEQAADAVAAYLPHRPRPGTTEGLRKNLREGSDGRLRWHWDPKLLLGPMPPDPEPAIPRFETACTKVRVPTLLVRGARSEMVSEAGVRDFLARIPGAEFVDVREAGHMVAGDDNDAFNAAVEGFLARLP
jgi:pimeloyl-ACP methyl ester carboxylesterase